MKTINNIYRYISLVIVIFSCFSMAGCRKFLDTQKQGEYTEEDYPYPGGAGPYDTFVFSAYNFLRDYNVHADAFIVATSIRSDDADKGSTPSDGGADVINMDNFPVLPTSGRANSLWTAYYTLINRCNTAIDQIRNNADIEAPDAVKDRSEAEVRFIRGYGYFMLVRLFGRVPIIEKVLDVSQTNVPQSESAQVYAFIEEDLRFAASNLPPSWEPRFIGRITSGAANGMLAKVYLTQQKWSAAMSAASLVMNSGQYDLSTPYERIFSEAGENSRESVFEVQATSSATVPTDNGVQYANIQGVRGTGDFNMGWGWNTPSEQLEAAYEPNDPRRNRTILYTVVNGEPGVSLYGERFPAGLPNPRYNNKVYTNPSYRSLYRNRGGWWMNVRILRYADIVLMYAEAANEVGGQQNIANAVEALNSVRRRARGSNPGILPDIVTTDQTVAREAIRHERRIELAMEHERFFDIVRWGIAEEVLHAAGKTAFDEDRDGLLPIPQTQIDLSKGVLTQNPYYNN
ncbi:RagB/SusD family nutrient uptake outer membrane protein [Pedobacter deserti]|uniref:RagB/SusD family nutrient uptake outer membrane protein n=1 Tax=Pedobacter deserti TaxID=2817382 RepID=UPI00210C6151|nr:RagB/SusD family nutrient uptake outer membrane protein [Pedobacter sp. SYSU D00382]